MKIAVFVALMLLVGARVFPWLIVRVAHLKSRELMSLGALALALGMAFTAYFLFEASFALGAFLAGVALNGTKFTHKIAEDSLPLRDTFAVLFFVSVGMLFDPMTLVRAPWAWPRWWRSSWSARVRRRWRSPALFKLPLEGRTAGRRGAGADRRVLLRAGGHGPMRSACSATDTYNLILAGALISIALNPLLFRLAHFAGRRSRSDGERAELGDVGALRPAASRRPWSPARSAAGTD